MKSRRGVSFVAVVYGLVMIFTVFTHLVNGSNTIMDVLSAHSDRFTVLIRALGGSGVSETLKKRKCITNDVNLSYF
jgi:hypothetical protein